MTSPGRLRVVWLSPSIMEKTPRGYTSRVASQRYRLAIPHAALSEQGCISSIRFIASNIELGKRLDQLKDADTVVVGKLWNPPEPRSFQALISVIEGLRSRGARVLADFCDDNFTDPERAPFDIALANSVDKVVASTPVLAETLRALTPAPVIVVSDPVEGLRGEPRAPAQGRGPLSLLWFGHPMNFAPLIAGLQRLETVAVEVPFSVSVVSAAEPFIEARVAALNEAWRGTGRSCRFRAWSVQTLFDALRECEAVIIPSSPSDPRKSVKSPNRFTESVWAGRFVLAHPLPAYLPFVRCGWVGDDLAAGLRWLVQNPEEALARIRAGQELVAAEHSPRAIGAAWKRALEEA